MLREYLVEGRSVRSLAIAHAESEARVRAALAGDGIRVDSDRQRDPVCAAVGFLGFASFAEFTRDHGLEPLSRQAEILGVSQNQLERIYDIFRRLAVEAPDGAA